MRKENKSTIIYAVFFVAVIVVVIVAFAALQKETTINRVSHFAAIHDAERPLLYSTLSGYTIAGVCGGKGCITMMSEDSSITKFLTLSEMSTIYDCDQHGQIFVGAMQSPSRLLIFSLPAKWALTTTFEDECYATSCISVQDLFFVAGRCGKYVFVLEITPHGEVQRSLVYNISATIHDIIADDTFLYIMGEINADAFFAVISRDTAVMRLYTVGGIGRDVLYQAAFTSDSTIVAVGQTTLIHDYAGFIVYFTVEKLSCMAMYYVDAGQHTVLYTVDSDSNEIFMGGSTIIRGEDFLVVRMRNGSISQHYIFGSDENEYLTKVQLCDDAFMCVGATAQKGFTMRVPRTLIFSFSGHIQMRDETVHMEALNYSVHEYELIPFMSMNVVRTSIHLDEMALDCVYVMPPRYYPIFTEYRAHYTIDTLRISWTAVDPDNEDVSIRIVVLFENNTFTTLGPLPSKGDIELPVVPQKVVIQYVAVDAGGAATTVELIVEATAYY